MDNYFEVIPEDVVRWDYVEQMNDFTSDDHPGDDNSFINNRPELTVQSLQRDYISLYGRHPKMEDRIYSTCGLCEQVFNPQTVTNHKNYCPGKGGRLQLQNLRKKVKSKKKIQSSSIPLPPLFKDSPTPPILPRYTDTVLPFDSNVNLPVSTPKLVNETIESRLSPVPPSPPSKVPTSPPVLTEVPRTKDIPLPPSTSSTSTASTSTSSSSSSSNNNSSSSSSSSRHRRSKKSSKSLKEYDPDVHCGVVEGQRGPCTRSITCSSHKNNIPQIQLRKSVPGRSKDIHLLIAEKKATKEKDSRHRSPPHSLPNDTKPSSDFIFPLLDNEAVHSNVQDNADSGFLTSSTSVTLSSLTENGLHDEGETANPTESGYCSSETPKCTPPIIYYNPISPIFVVTPVQFVQKENSVFVDKPQPVLSPALPNGSYFLSIPEQSSNIKIYKSHPKPAILPSYGARKVGGAILSSNQRLEYQRNDIQTAINTRRKATTSGCKVPPQRSLLMKTKSLNKVNSKRPSTDKLVTTDNNTKIIKLADVNGYILHTDMSEAADAPQPNHCIQENINLLNMSE